jgi:hypothetical protein
VSAVLAQRTILVGAAALLAAVLALAIAERRDGAVNAGNLPRAVPAPGGGWYEARAGLESPRAYGRPTACGKALERSTMGVSHPVLVCGAKIYIGHGRTEMLTQVVARGPGSAGVQFGLTEALAGKLGVRGRTTIRWRFASPEG